MAPPIIPSSIVLGYGAFGRWFTPLVLNEVARLGWSAEVLATGLLDWEHPTDAPVVPLPPLVAPDISHTLAEVQAIRDANKQDRSPAPFLHAQGEKLVQVVSPVDPEAPQLLVLADLRALPDLAPVLREWKRQRLPALSISLVVRWPEPGHDDRAAHQGLAAIRDLHADGSVDLTYAVHPRSPLALRVGEDGQLHLVAALMATLLVAHRADEHNKSLAALSQSVGARAGVAGMALASAPVSVGRRHWASRAPLLRRRLRGDVGYGDPADCFNVATARAASLLEDERARTIAAAFELNTPPYELVIVVPLRTDDRRLPQLASDLRHQVTRAAPLSGTPTIVGGGGQVTRLAATSEGAAGRYTCRVAWVFGVPDTALESSLHVAAASAGDTTTTSSETNAEPNEPYHAPRRRTGPTRAQGTPPEVPNVAEEG